jgi:hypothetical protein
MHDNILYHSLPGLESLRVQSVDYRNQSIRDCGVSHGTRFVARCQRMHVQWVWLSFLPLANRRIQERPEKSPLHPHL